MSKPSGAMVTVAAMPNTVVMDMARRMLIMLLTDMKRLPVARPNTTKHSTSVMTAAQSSRKRRKVLFFFVASGLGFNVACISRALLLWPARRSGVLRGAAHGIVHDFVLVGLCGF